MLRTGFPLFFPKLVWCKEVATATPRSRKHNIFQLDWDAHEARLRAIHEKWQDRLKNSSTAKREKWEPALLEPWAGIVREQKYAIDERYRDAIRDHSEQAVSGWGENGDRSFDTYIRDMCLEPAICHVAVAFKLLVDCTFDEKTKQFSRDRPYWLSQALLYTFWHKQTGAGLLWEHSEMDELEEKVARLSASRVLSGDEATSALDFIGAVKARDAHREKAAVASVEDPPSTEIHRRKGLLVRSGLKHL